MVNCQAVGRMGHPLSVVQLLSQGMLGLHICILEPGFSHGFVTLLARPHNPVTRLQVIRRDQLEGTAEIAHSFGRGKLPEGLFSCLFEVWDCSERLSGLFPMVSQQAQPFIVSLREHLLQCQGHLLMEFATLFFQQAVIGSLLGQRMFEDVFQLRGARLLTDHLFIYKRIQVRIQSLLGRCNLC